MSWYGAFVLLEEYMASLMYFRPYKQKPRYVLRLLGCFLVSAAFVVWSGTLPGGSLNTAIRYIVYFLLLMASMWLCHQVTWPQALFSAVAGQATQHFVSSFICLINAGGSILRIENNLLSACVEILIFYVPWYTVAFYLVAKRIDTKGYEDPNNLPLKLLSAVVLFVCIVISRFAKDFNRTEPSVIIAESLYAMVCCALCLTIQFEICRRNQIQGEIETIRKMWQEDKRHLTQSKEIMELINVKCHDIRHKIQEHSQKLSTQEIQELDDLIQIYDTALDTGNSTLNVIVADRGLLCERQKIQFTFMGDGRCLSFLNESEVYSLFGNALNNAIEASASVDEAMRQISVVIQYRGGLVSISIINYYNGSLQFFDGLPTSTNTDDPGCHGYGMRSMQLIAQKHGGDIQVTANGSVFELNIWMFAA